jgi:hypothetical protein
LGSPFFGTINSLSPLGRTYSWTGTCCAHREVEEKTIIKTMRSEALFIEYPFAFQLKILERIPSFQLTDSGLG